MKQEDRPATVGIPLVHEGEDANTEVVQSCYSAGRCRMVRTTAVDAPHEWARFGWRFESADGTAVLTGTDMVHLTAAGDIDQIVVFAGPLPQEG